MDKRLIIGILVPAAGALAWGLTRGPADRSDTGGVSDAAIAARGPVPHTRTTEGERLVMHEVRSILTEQKKRPGTLTTARLQPLMNHARTAEGAPTRAAAVTGLASVKHASSQVIDTIITGMDDPSPLVRKRAAKALRRLTGRTFKGYRPDAPPDQRARAINHIRAVFKKAKLPQTDA